MIAMSGTSVGRARPVGIADVTFEAFIKSFGAACDTADEQLDILRNAQDDEITAHTRSNIATFPLMDGDIIPQITTYNSLSTAEEMQRTFPGIKKCERLLIGDCQMDVSLLYPRRVTARYLTFASVSYSADQYSGHDLGFSSSWAHRHSSKNTGELFVCQFGYGGSKHYATDFDYIRHRRTCDFEQ